MNEELNKELEQEVKDETSMPEETMEDYAAELEASYQTLNKRNIEAAEDESGEMEKWNNFVQMKELLFPAPMFPLSMWRIWRTSRVRPWRQL